MLRRLSPPVLAAAALLAAAVPANAASPDIVIGEVYGGGGNSGAPLRNDFVELYNRGTTTVSLNGTSLQYASATGTGNFAANAIATLSGNLGPGERVLIAGAGGSVGDPLPTPDFTGARTCRGRPARWRSWTRRRASGATAGTTRARPGSAR